MVVTSSLPTQQKERRARVGLENWPKEGEKAPVALLEPLFTIRCTRALREPSGGPRSVISIQNNARGPPEGLL